MESMAEGMIKDLVASGHALADDMTGAPSVLVRCLAAQLEVQLVRANELAEDHQRAIESIKQADAAVKLAHEKFSALAAENATFKDINAWCKTDAFSNMYREFKTAEAVGCCNIDCMHDAMLVAIMHAPETPATDAFLAEVRAQGVEMFAECAYTLEHHDHAVAFAAELREGGNK